MSGCALLAHTVYLPEDGDFVHCDGRRALRCLVNDSWHTITRALCLDRDVGLACHDDESCRVTVHYPQPAYRALDGVYTCGDILDNILNSSKLRP